MKDLLWQHSVSSRVTIQSRSTSNRRKVPFRSCVEARLESRLFGAVDANEGVIGLRGFAQIRNEERWSSIEPKVLQAPLGTLRPFLVPARSCVSCTADRRRRWCGLRMDFSTWSRGWPALSGPMSWRMESCAINWQGISDRQSPTGVQSNSPRAAWSECCSLWHLCESAIGEQDLTAFVADSKLIQAVEKPFRGPRRRYSSARKR